MGWKVYYFQTRRGEHPVEDFINKQDKSMQGKIWRMIRLLIKFGPLLQPPYSKKLARGIYELRTQGNIAFRLLYCCIRGQFYLLHAFKKKTQKTPIRELKTAIDRLKEII